MTNLLPSHSELNALHSVDFWLIFSTVFNVVSFSSYSVIKGWQEKSRLCSLGWKSISGWGYP